MVGIPNGARVVLIAVRVVVVTLLLSGAAAGIAAFSLLYELGVLDLTRNDVKTILAWQPADNTVIYDRDGNKLSELYSADHVYVPYAQLPEPLVEAILAIEDRSFWSHPGVDLKGIIRAVFIYMTQEGDRYRQGASTITQQVVRHFLLPREKTLSRKIGEIFLALKLEGWMKKERILEIYTNSLFLGQGAYGVGAAARRYFGKPLGQLRLHELALIAGLFQSPSRLNPWSSEARARKRQLSVLRAMTSAGYLTAGEARRWASESLDYERFRPSIVQSAPYFVDYVRYRTRQILNRPSVKNQGLRVFTTLDSKLQDLAKQAIVNSDRLLTKAAKQVVPQQRPDGTVSHPPLEAAILVTDPRNGEVLAMVGGRDYRRSQFNRAFQARRQPGSSFKPIVYSLALSRGYRWSDVIYVSPITVAGNYRPRSQTRDYVTETTMLRAFYRSMNTPTVEIGQKLGMQRVVAFAHKMGIRSSIRFEFGSVLGSSEVTLLDMARVYSVFANQGRLADDIAIQRIEDHSGEVLYSSAPVEARSEEILSPQLAYLMVQGMRNVLLRGTGYSARELAARTAGKTGTSNEARDNWFSGFSSDLVATVWVGTDEAASLRGDAQASSLALPIWKRFMSKALKERPSEPFAVPPGLVAMTVHPRYGRVSRDGIKMWFVENHTPRTGQSPLEGLDAAEHFRDPFGDRLQ